MTSIVLRVSTFMKFHHCFSCTQDCCSLAQVSSSECRVSPWTSCQFVAGLHRNLINLNSTFLHCWGRRSTCRNPTQTREEHANSTHKGPWPCLFIPWLVLAWFWKRQSCQELYTFFPLSWMLAEQAKEKGTAGNRFGFDTGRLFFPLLLAQSVSFSSQFLQLFRTICPLICCLHSLFPHLLRLTFLK